MALRTLLVACVLCLGCQVPPPQPHKGLGKLWRDYQALPPKRALAICGDPDGAWVGSMAGAAESQDDAIDVALEGCRVKRRERRLRTPCLLYAVDDEIVWMTR